MNFATPGEVAPGLLVLHGNRTELLGEAVFAWLRRQPLQPLEQELFLVQSNGMAEWLKMAIAGHDGVFAASRVELPARFLWRAYRQMLGRDAVPAESVLDKLPLTWRLMHLLPEVAAQPGFEPLASFLDRGGMDRRLQLARRLADLYDQYQVCRGDWLDAWAEGLDILPGPSAGSLPTDQRWQAALWRAILAPLDAAQRDATRPRLQQRFVAALSRCEAPAAALPRRVVLFGTSHLPTSTLAALAALASRCQVVLAIPNPCRYHWADAIEGRELLAIERRRQPSRGGRDLAAVPFELMHAHAHPLLAAWGRQARDVVRQLDAFDDALAARQRFALPRIDLFDDEPGHTLLQQVQASIRDLLPLAEHPRRPVDMADRSIVFHVGHGAQREVEILHDQLLQLLADPPGGQPLAPRDIVVMVPEIDAFAPAIRSVFGQYPRNDPRHIRHDIADLQQRGHQPLLVALEWLLRLPQQRCRASEVRDLLEVPAVAARFGLAPGDLPQLARWIAGAGVRWGLDRARRSALDLAACGEQNSWLFGLRRMLLGYAVGDAAAFTPPAADADAGADTDAAPEPIQPYGEIGGLDAALVGPLADLVDALIRWATLAATPAAPRQWAERCRGLLDDFFAPADDADRRAAGAAQEALRGWLAACAGAGFDEPVTLPVAREAWLAGIDTPGLNQRFLAGGVTFCTLLPMRAIPFELVCLLGMNDGDYPRRSPRSDFDLMEMPGMARPGDRSRRQDDRQLMLDALLSARRQLYISWAGRSARDNSPQPPSVLVSQLRDYLDAGWAAGTAALRTTEHPLQPFSRRYFEQPAEPGAERRAGSPPLFSHAREWRAAHAAGAVAAALAAVPPFEPDPRLPLTLAALASFLRNPVRDHFRRRLDVRFGEAQAAVDDDEPFTVGGRDAYALLEQALDAIVAESPVDDADLADRIAAQAARWRGAGRLPMAAQGRRVEQTLARTLQPMLSRWFALLAHYPSPAPKQPLRFDESGVHIVDWLDGLRQSDDDPGRRVWLQLTPSRLLVEPGKSRLRGKPMLAAWLRTLVGSACGVAVPGVVVGCDATVSVDPLPAGQAQDQLRTLLQVWRAGMAAPLPLPCQSAFEQARGGDAAKAYQGRAYAANPGANPAANPGGNAGAEVAEPCLAREFPDFAALAADGRFAALAGQVHLPIVRWLDAALVDAHPDLATAPAADGCGNG